MLTLSLKMDGKTAVPEFIDPRFRETKPKAHVFSH
jgi:hypothetical protein